MLHTHTWRLFIQHLYFLNKTKKKGSTVSWISSYLEVRHEKHVMLKKDQSTVTVFFTLFCFHVGHHLYICQCLSPPPSTKRHVITCVQPSPVFLLFSSSLRLMSLSDLKFLFFFSFLFPFSRSKINNLK